MSGLRGQTDWTKAMNQLQKEKDSSSFSGPKFKKDDRFFFPEVSEGKKYECVIRFLPAPDTLPWVETARHSFKDDNDVIWGVNCPTAIGERCPICEAQRKLWADGRADVYRLRKKTKTRHSNILVVEDQQNPENEGKVFIFRYGKQIQSKIEQLIEEEGSAASVFDYEQGTDMKLKICMKGEYRNYDDSIFKRTSTPLGKDVQKSVDAQLHDLLPFIDKSKFKGYDELAQEYFDRTGDAPATWTSKNVQPTSQPAVARTVVKEDGPFQPVNDYKAPVPVAKFDDDDDDDFLAKIQAED